ncbi:MAG: ASKHA domain-containing protein [Desulfobacteraceae bacterium]|nr:ASKHA domain-containing protein [Desulfobacteraceae bacterium]
MDSDFPNWLKDQPLVQSLTVELVRPSLEDNAGDMDRLVRALSRPEAPPVTIHPSRMIEFCEKIRTSGFRCRTILGFTGMSCEILDILPVSSEDPVLGFAVDLGTSSLVFRLIDIGKRAIVREIAVRNPQIQYGEDILSRILFARSAQGRKILRTMLVDACSRAMRDCLDLTGLRAENVYALSCAGNTAMTHFFWGVDASNICREPYIPAANNFPVGRAVDLGFDLFPNALLYTFPNVGSYVGGDIVSGILAAGVHRSGSPRMLIDVGTNAEVVLGNAEWLIACAGAAGPALEGGVVARGMQAVAGAIDRVRIDRRTLQPEWRVIGGGKPAGICGSGLIDLIAEMFSAGIVTVQGKFDRSIRNPRLRSTPDGLAYVFALAGETPEGEELAISEIDLGVFLKSKAAMYTILSIIVGKVGLRFEDLEEISVAGTFGNRIDPEMAVRIGMIPDLPREIYRGIGNSSLLGAAMLLMDRTLLDEVNRVRNRITYIELNVDAALMSEFRGALFLPHTNRRLFPSVLCGRDYPAPDGNGK